MHARPGSRGFTLIEILIVVAIIAILASVVLIGLGPTQRSGRDARRISDLSEISNALELYYQSNGTFLVAGSGWQKSGEGWLSYQAGANYTLSVEQGLVNAGVLSAVIRDPSGRDKGTVAGQTGYMIYECPVLSVDFTLYAGLENPNQEELNQYASVTNECGGDPNDPGDSGGPYGMNYASHEL